MFDIIDVPITKNVVWSAFYTLSIMGEILREEIVRWEKSEGLSFLQSFRVPNGVALFACSLFFIELVYLIQSRPEGAIIGTAFEPELLTLKSTVVLPIIALPPLFYLTMSKKAVEKVAFLTKEHESLQAAYPKGAVKITSSHVGKILTDRWLTITYSYPLPMEKILEHNQQELKKLGWILVEYANNDREHYYDYKKDDQKLTWMTLRLWPDKYPDGAAVDGESQISVTIGNRPPTDDRYFPPKKVAG